MQKISKIIFVVLILFFVGLCGFLVSNNKWPHSEQLNYMSVASAKEIIEKRNYNQKVYDLGEGKLKYKIHIADIHYKEDGEFKDINTELEETDYGWKMQKASYELLLPKYSDQEFYFINKYEDTPEDAVIMRPLGNFNVEGKLIQEGDWDKKSILYKNTFGNNIDLKVISKNIGFDKLIVINEKPENIEKDLEFSFEINLQDFQVNYGDNVWDKENSIEIKGDIILKKLKDTWFREFKVWDSANKSALIKVRLENKDGKYIFTKIISQEFLDKAVYPVFTDDTNSYYAGVGDGNVYYNDNNWSGTQSAITGNGVDYTYSSSSVMSYRNISTPDYYIYRSFFPIDTSGINDGDTIDSAKFYFYAETYYYDELGGSIYLVQTSQASTSELTTSDYSAIGTTEGANTIDVSNIMTTSWNYFTLDATGLGFISKIDFTKIGVREYFDINNTEPLVDGYSVVSMATSETNNDPYLEVVTSSGDSTPPVPSNFSPASGSTIIDSTPTITFTTDENATCYLSLDGDEAYADMADDTLCTGGGTTSQSCTSPDLGANGAKSIYIACTDGTNADTADTNENLTYTLSISTGGQPYFLFKASAEEYGSISPDGLKYIIYGGTQTYTIIPDTGYQIQDVLVDQVSVGPQPTYTFNNINASHTITAVFEAIKETDEETTQTTDETDEVGGGGTGQDQLQLEKIAFAIQQIQLEIKQISLIIDEKVKNFFIEKVYDQMIKLLGIIVQVLT